MLSPDNGNVEMEQTHTQVLDLPSSRPLHRVQDRPAIACRSVPPASMRGVFRRIQAWVQDDLDRWVAQVECGHLVDVPPDASPPAPEWSRTEHGRQNLVGSLLECPSCRVGLDVARPQPSVVHADATPHSWRSFWVRPKAPPARVQPIWLDSKIACGSVCSVPDLERLARLGFRDVVCLDQAGEPGQGLSPLFEGSWVRALAMSPHWIAVDPARIQGRDVDRFLDVVRSVRGPVLVHSTDDRRAIAFSAIWLGLARGLDDSEVLQVLVERGLSIDGRCEQLVRLHLGKSLGEDGFDHTQPHRCYRLYERPHVPRSETGFTGTASGAQDGVTSYVSSVAPSYVGDPGVTESPDRPPQCYEPPRTMVDGSSRFRTPEELLDEPGLSHAWKADVLRSWEYEERQIAVAVDEGMPGPDPLLLRRILEALHALEDKQSVHAPQ